MESPRAPATPDPDVTCSACDAVCCRLDVLLITDTGVPDQFIATDRWGGMTMARQENEWCAALDLDAMRCRIYDRRPWICREFEMGGPECIAERAAFERSRPERTSTIERTTPRAKRKRRAQGRR